MILKFIETVEETQGPIAIHCKTGLSKTGTLIGLYAMKNFDITAQEYIAWSRICRPGSVIGSQQEFLLEMEAKCKAMKKKEVILAQTPKTHRELKRKQTVISKNKGMTFTSLASNASLHKKNSYSNIPPRWQTATPTTPVNFKRSQTPIASPFSYASVFSQYLSKINLNYNVN